MIFNRNGTTVNRRVQARERSLSPRLAALLQESWWLLVVALFAYLALILATYQRSDAAWSFTGNGSATLNKGGVVGAWLSDLLLYLFGMSAWWWVFAGAVAVVSGYRRLGLHGRRDGDAERRHHPWLAVPGFAALLLSSAALEALRDSAFSIFAAAETTMTRAIFAMSVTTGTAAAASMLIAPAVKALTLNTKP